MTDLSKAVAAQYLVPLKGFPALNFVSPYQVSNIVETQNFGNFERANTTQDFVSLRRDKDAMPVY